MDCWTQLELTEIDAKSAPQARKVTNIAGSIDRGGCFRRRDHYRRQKEPGEERQIFLWPRGAWFFQAFKPYSFSVFRCVFASQARATPGLSPG